MFLLEGKHTFSSKALVLVIKVVQLSSARKKSNNANKNPYYLAFLHGKKGGLCICIQQKMYTLLTCF